MANVAHASLTGASLHEPKGVASAAANTVYVADGAGSGAWEDISTSSVAGRWDLIATVSGSNVSSLNFTGFNPSLYKDYKLVIQTITPATDAVLWLRTSTNGGSSYFAGSTDYWYYTITGQVGNNPGQASANEASYIAISGAANQDSALALKGTINLINPGNLDNQGISWHTGGHDGANNFINIGFGGKHGLNDIDAVQLLFSTGNVSSGAVRFYGLVV